MGSWTNKFNECDTVAREVCAGHYVNSERKGGGDRIRQGKAWWGGQDRSSNSLRLNSTKI